MFFITDTCVQLIGVTHAEYPMDHVDDCTVDMIFDRMQKVQSQRGIVVVRLM